jgi:mannitol 2-dehydrogenase
VDSELAAWIESNCAFPNAMVDCIVPATGPREMSLARQFGIDDLAPVTHEPFRQWVIEDKFCAGRPDWDTVGATFSNRVHDYETIKIRVLNGAGQILGPVSDLLGIEFVGDALKDQRIRSFFRKCEEEEILPHVRGVPGYTPLAYLDLVEKRFGNLSMADTTRRFSHDGTSRHAGFILPSVRDGLASGAPVEGLALVSALWCRYCLGAREDGSVIEPNDPIWNDLQQRAAAAVEEPLVWLTRGAVYGNLSQQSRFAGAFVRWRKRIDAEGIGGALGAYCSL